VEDVNDPTQQPISGSCLITWTAPGSKSCEIYTVPIGKRLIVRDISFRCYFSTTADIQYGRIRGGNPLIAQSVVVPVLPMPSEQSAQKAGLGVRSVFYQAPPGDVMASAELLNDATSSPSCHAIIHGYLVDVH
jgi:hypothetical protein